MDCSRCSLGLGHSSCIRSDDSLAVASRKIGYWSMGKRKISFCFLFWNLVLFQTILRLVVYIFNVLATVFFIVMAGVSLWWLIFFKVQFLRLMTNRIIPIDFNRGKMQFISLYQLLHSRHRLLHLFVWHLHLKWLILFIWYFGNQVRIYFSSIGKNRSLVRGRNEWFSTFISHRRKSQYGLGLANILCGQWVPWNSSLPSD